MNNLSLRLHHFGITVPNLEETINWYRENLGFTYDYTYEIDALQMKAAFMSLGDFDWRYLKCKTLNRCRITETT